MNSFQDLITLAGSFPTNSPMSEEAWKMLHDAAPEDLGYEDLVTGVEKLGRTNPRASLVATLAWLKKKGPKTGENVRAAQDDDEEAAASSSSIRRLCDYVATTIAPCWTPKGEGDGDEEEAPEYEYIARHSRETSPYGLEILDILTSTTTKPPFLSLYNDNDNDELLITLIALADPAPAEAAGQDDEQPPWATPTTRARATAVLDRLLAADHLDLDLVLVDVLLKRYLRPLFARARPATVTPSGRPAAFRDNDDGEQGQRGLRGETPAVKPWKYADHRAIPVLHFAVRRAEEPLLRKQWPLFVPVLLTLLDDTTTRVRVRGLVVLRDFLARFPPPVLRATGLARVFEDAVFPTLHFLPGLTPEAESVRLLGPAYAALLALAGGHNHGDSTPDRAKLLDKILRGGVFSAYSHAKENVRIVQILLEQTARVLDEMGVYAVKHLKDLIPMHSEVMTDPFAALAPSTLLAATKSLQATIANGWPRLATTPAYQNELIKALVVCFLAVQDDQDKLDGAQFSAIEAELIKTAAMLSAVTKTGGGEWEGKGGNYSLQDKVAPLVAKEPMLQKLFKE